jgi:hypothetical protein
MMRFSLLTLPPQVDVQKQFHRNTIIVNRSIDSTDIFVSLSERTQIFSPLTLSPRAMANNKLTGSIPSSIGQLSMLNALYLDRNGLSGTMPSTLAQLTALTVLCVAENVFQCLTIKTPQILARKSTDRGNTNIELKASTLVSRSTPIH